MSRRGTRSLRVVGGVFASRELELARQLGKCETALRAASLQLEELRAHQRNLSASAVQAGVTDPGRMQNRQAFYARLGDAIAQQQRTVLQARAARDDARQRWMLSRQKKSAIDKVCVRREAQLQQQQDRREQQRSDEHGARRRRSDGLPD